MKKILSSLFLCGGLSASLIPSCIPSSGSAERERVAEVAQALTAVDLCYLGGAGLPNVSLNGDATLDGNGIELTAAEGSQAGSTFFRSKLTSDADIHAAFELRFSQHQDGGGEGIAFVLQAAANGPTALVTSSEPDAGKNLAYDGLTPAIAIEFDTVASGAFDPNGSHVALTRGKVDHDAPENATLPVISVPFDLKTTSSIHAWFDYEVLTHTLGVYVSTKIAKPALPLFVTSEVNLATELGPTFYAGFTASTSHAGLPDVSPASRQQVLGFLVTDHGPDALAACCLLNAECKNPAASICDAGSHICGACSLTDVSKCAATEGCDVSDGAGKCVPSCNTDSECSSPDFPVCSLTGATSGSCVACSANYGDPSLHACGVGAKVCKAIGYCGSGLGTGTACTIGEECDSAFCVDGVCCDSACAGGDTSDCQACTQKAGGTKDGMCTTVTDATPCEDGDLCTVGDACSTGACTEGPVTDCSLKGSCTSAVGCTCTAGYAGLTCQYSDEDDCTGHGVAQADGSCKCTPNYGGSHCQKCAVNHFGENCASVCNPASCPVPANGCQTAACSEEGTCTYTVVAEGATCTDGNACTTADSCVGNKCVGAKPVSCVPVDTCHEAGVCDYKTGECLNPLLPDLTVCSSEVGDAGQCAAGACIVPDPLANRGKGGNFGTQGGYACSVANTGSGGAQAPLGLVVLALGIIGFTRRR